LGGRQKKKDSNHGKKRTVGKINRTPRRLTNVERESVGPKHKHWLGRAGGKKKKNRTGGIRGLFTYELLKIKGKTQINEYQVLIRFSLAEKNAEKTGGGSRYLPSRTWEGEVVSLSKK